MRFFDPYVCPVSYGPPNATPDVLAGSLLVSTVQNGRFWFRCWFMTWLEACTGTTAVARPVLPDVAISAAKPPAMPTLPAVALCRAMFATAKALALWPCHCGMMQSLLYIRVFFPDRENCCCSKESRVNIASESLGEYGHQNNDDQNFTHG